MHSKPSSAQRMATPAQPAQRPARPRHSRIVRCIAMILLTLIVIVGVVVLTIWLVVKPKRVMYTVEDGSIHGFNLASNGHLNATFNFVLRSYNANSKVSIYYDKMEVKVVYDDQIVAYNSVDPFFQPHRNVTRLGLMLVAQDVPMFGDAAKDLKLERSAGAIELEVQVKARIRFKVGVWKSRDRTMRVDCSPVLVHFSSSKSFERTICEIDL